MNEPNTTAEEGVVRNCRSCPASYVPSFIRDFYPDDPAHPEIGLCEDCMMREAAPKVNSSPALIPADHLKTCCQPKVAGKTCAFLTFGQAFSCAKGSGFESLIRQRLSEGTMGATSDNCSGPPDFTPTAE